jgi:dTDP-4-amino-4,6-dideoxygalactose transaminase
MIPYVRPFFETAPDFFEQLKHLYSSGLVTNNGPYVQEFERLLCSYLNSGGVVAVSTGFDALLLGLLALEIRKLSKVILPAYTFVATLNAVVAAGYQPLLCDIDPARLTMDPGCLEKLLELSSDVTCVLPVNVFGVPPDLQTIRTLCERKGAQLLYDNSHGFGTTISGSANLCAPRIQTLSFHATKALPAIEGGAVVSKDEALLAKVRNARNHGICNPRAEMRPGYNCKMDEIRALTGINSLSSFPQSLERRRSYGARLRHCIAQYPEHFALQNIPEVVCSNFQNLPLIVPAAESLGIQTIINQFREAGVEVRSYFDIPLNFLTPFRPLTLPVTEAIWRTSVCLPLYSRMEESTLEKIEAALFKVADYLTLR